MYLVTEPFRGSPIATVQSKSDSTIAEYLGNCEIDGVEYQFFENDVKVVDESTYFGLVEQYEQSLCDAPKLIDTNRFIDVQSLLPPERWSIEGDIESFYIDERYYGNVVSWFLRIKDKCFECRNTTKVSKDQLHQILISYL